MLHVRGLSFAYGAASILENLSFEVKEGEIVSLVGVSGSGKTTVLRLVSDLARPTQGSIGLAISPQDIGFLFQDDALLPFKTVLQNVMLGLRIRGISKKEASGRAREWLVKLGIDVFASRYPPQLSGGQRKRVAIAQVLVMRPRLVLMDEPFASLDAIRRMHITQELLRLVEQEHLTALLVTHDLSEAVAVSDTVYVLSEGPRACIQGRYEVPIPRPRNVLEVRSHPAFNPLVMQLWKDLSCEVGSSVVKK